MFSIAISCLYVVCILPVSCACLVSCRMVRARCFPGEAAGEVGGARPVAGGEARRLPGEAHVSRPAGRRREMRAEKGGEKALRLSVSE